ncbi:hypothetical protein GQ457_03G003390 [Hibiscus cannabinus]
MAVDPLPVGLSDPKVGGSMLAFSEFQSYTKRYGSLKVFQDEVLSEAQRKKRDRVLRRNKKKMKDLETSELEGRSLPNFDLKTRWNKCVVEARKALALGKKLGIQIHGDEEDVGSFLKVLGADFLSTWKEVRRRSVNMVSEPSEHDAGDADNSDRQSTESEGLRLADNQFDAQFANKQVNIRLDDFNYLLWKQQVILMIRGHDLEHYLDPDTPVPSKVVTDATGQISLNPAYRRFKKEDSSLASWLLSTISASILPQLVGAETSAAIWTTVQKLYSNFSTTKIMNLHCRLRALKKGTLSIREYTTQVKDICDLLATSDSPVAEVEQIATILNGLTAEYEPFVAAMTVSRESYTLESVTSALHDAESRILDSIRVPIGINMTQFNNSSKSGEGEATNNSRSYSNMRSKGQYNSRYKGRPRVQCQLCGKLGHLVDRCWHRFDKNFKGVSSAPTADGTKDVLPEATDDTAHINSLIARGVLTMNDKWYPDSGASHHVASSQKSVQQYRPYSGTGKVYLGDGSMLPITHVGNTVVSTSEWSLVIRNMLCAIVKNQFSANIIALQTDGGGEFAVLEPTLVELGIQVRVTCPRTSAQNGGIERKHRHIIETTLTLLAHASVPFHYWSFAALSAVYLINRMPLDSLGGISPHQKLYGKAPRDDFLKVFGCQCFPCLRSFNRNKFAYRSKACVFLGYSPKHHGYLCLDDTGRVFVSRHVQFNEDIFPFLEKAGVQQKPPSFVPCSSVRFPKCFTNESGHMGGTMPTPAQPVIVEDAAVVNDGGMYNSDFVVPDYAQLPVADGNFVPPTANVSNQSLSSNETLAECHEDGQNSEVPGASQRSPSCDESGCPGNQQSGGQESAASQQYISIDHLLQFVGDIIVPYFAVVCFVVVKRIDLNLMYFQANVDMLNSRIPQETKTEWRFNLHSMVPPDLIVFFLVGVSLVFGAEQSLFLNFLSLCITSFIAF